ncbi:MAG: RluA family pseudouridine synthase [Candidatus Harrisonbacteria bacterium]|nr:RluA family pseudouridine synthase [Candidatus Harrisonbacteria bacterium]
MDTKVIYQDKNLLVLNKPAGLLTHGTKEKREEASLADWLLNNYPEVRTVGDDPVSRPGIVHRLDKDTSGVLIAARNQETFDYLKALFQKHLVQKTYLALVYGKIKEKSGIIDKPIGIKSGSTKRSTHSEKMKKAAITEYKVIKYVTLRQAQGKSVETTLLEVTPKTGRTHQIRVHLAAIGYPVVGDKLYGGKRPPAGLTRQFLHAQSLEFTLPTGERMKFEADLPEELKLLLKSD